VLEPQAHAVLNQFALNGLRLRYNKPLALVKNLFAVYRGHPIAQEATSSVTRHAGRESSAVTSRHPISYSPVVQP